MRVQLLHRWTLELFVSWQDKLTDKIAPPRYTSDHAGYNFACFCVASGFCCFSSFPSFVSTSFCLVSSSPRTLVLSLCLQVSTLACLRIFFVLPALAINYAAFPWGAISAPFFGFCSLNQKHSELSTMGSHIMWWLFLVIQPSPSSKW